MLDVCEWSDVQSKIEIGEGKGKRRGGDGSVIVFFFF